jgi:hypothetical protein
MSARTPLSLVIKTITTHAFAIVTYAYASNLLRRPTRSHVHALRLLFFLFVPTLPLVELLTSAIRALIQFLTEYQDDEKDDELHVRYYFSGALGLHAQLSQDDDDKDTTDSRRNMHLLDIGSHAAEKHKVPIDWVWAGKLFASLFTLLQAVGTIVMWGRRLNTWEANTLAFDHRNGAMGIASSICSSICILILALRLNWKVSKTFKAADQTGWSLLRTLGIAQSQKNQLICDCLLSMLLHGLIATAANHDNVWLYRSVGTLWVTLSFILFRAWQTAFLLIFFFIFRDDIFRRLGLDDEKYAKYRKYISLKRIKALLSVALVVWILTDIIWLLVADIVRLVDERRNCRGCAVWWQDPISDELIVI